MIIDNCNNKIFKSIIDGNCKYLKLLGTEFYNIETGNLEHPITLFPVIADYEIYGFEDITSNFNINDISNLESDIWLSKIPYIRISYYCNDRYYYVNLDVFNNNLFIYDEKTNLDSYFKRYKETPTITKIEKINYNVTITDHSSKIENIDYYVNELKYRIDNESNR